MFVFSIMHSPSYFTDKGPITDFCGSQWLEKRLSPFKNIMHSKICTIHYTKYGTLRLEREFWLGFYNLEFSRIIFIMERGTN